MSDAQSLAGVGHGVLDMKAALVDIEKMDGPGDSVATRLLCEEVAVGGEGVRADENWIALEDLVVRSDPDLREIFVAVDDAGLLDGVHDDVVDCPDGGLVFAGIPKEVDDAPVGAVAMEDRGEDDLPEPFLGDRDVEEDPLVLFFFGMEFGGKCTVGLLDLLVDELPADIVISGENAQRLGASDTRDCQELAPIGRYLGSGGKKGLIRRRRIADNLGDHACSSIAVVLTTAVIGRWRAWSLPEYQLLLK